MKGESILRGTIYLLHFDKPIADGHPAQHYLGWTKHLPSRALVHLLGALFPSPADRAAYEADRLLAATADDAPTMREKIEILFSRFKCASHPTRHSS